MRNKYKYLLVIIGFTIFTFFFWEHWSIYPLKLLVVMMHETAHALATLLTGGVVEGIKVNSRQGGLTLTKGGIQLIILSAGYLGSSLIGAITIYASTRKPWQNFIAEVFGALIILETLLWVRDLFTFTFAIGMGVLCILIGRYIRWIKAIFMQIIGTMCCLYAIYDIRSDILSGQSWYSSGRDQASDAQALADLTLIPSIVWGALWIAIALAIFAYTLWRLSKSPVSAQEKGHG